LTGDTLYATVLEENQRKNFTLSFAVDISSKVTLKNFSWRFDDNRILHVSSPVLTAQNKSLLQQLADNRFGAGKVIVE
jgi:hypothetical protein